jgi:purine-binding chemotaxis protein CheW
MTPILEQPLSTGVAALAGKYLTFILGKEFYGIRVLAVREIIRMVDITAVPRMPEFVRGVINLRGKIIPVIDLRIKFALGKAETAERTCIIVVQVKTASGTTNQTGIIVDAVEEVVSIAANEIEETPEFGAAVDTQYIVGMAKIKGQVKTLLDIEAVVGTNVLPLNASITA